MADNDKDSTPGADIGLEMAMRPLRIFEAIVRLHSGLLDKLSDTNMDSAPYWDEVGFSE